MAIVDDAFENLVCARSNAIDGSANVSNSSPGGTFTYCLTFILPDTDDVSKIEVSAIAGSGSGHNTWAFIETFAGWKS
jgi:hypothetical protein